MSFCGVFLHLWTCFAPFPSISIVVFEQVNIYREAFKVAVSAKIGVEKIEKNAKIFDSLDILLTSVRVN